MLWLIAGTVVKSKQLSNPLKRCSWLSESCHSFWISFSNTIRWFSQLDIYWLHTKLLYRIIFTSGTCISNISRESFQSLWHLSLEQLQSAGQISSFYFHQTALECIKDILPFISTADRSAYRRNLAMIFSQLWNHKSFTSRRIMTANFSRLKRYFIAGFGLWLLLLFGVSRMFLLTENGDGSIPILARQTDGSRASVEEVARINTALQKIQKLQKENDILNMRLRDLR